MAESAVVSRIVMGFLDTSGPDGAFEEAVNHILRGSWERDEVEEYYRGTPFPRWTITLSNPDGHEHLEVWIAESSVEIEEYDLETPLVYRQITGWQVGQHMAPEDCDMDPTIPFTQYHEGVCDYFRLRVSRLGDDLDVNSLMPGTSRLSLCTPFERAVTADIVQYAVGVVVSGWDWRPWS